MLRFLIVALLFAGLVYLLVRVIDRRMRLSKGPVHGPARRGQQQRRTIAPDDDDQFLRDLEKKRREEQPPPD